MPKGFAPSVGVALDLLRQRQQHLRTRRYDSCNASSHRPQKKGTQRCPFESHALAAN